MTDCRHYQVLSEERIAYSQYEPPEPWRAFAIVEADTKREAMIVACRLPEFKEWVDEQRGDKVPPYKGLTVSRCVCDHGVCWGCADYCEICISEHDAQMAAELGA